MDSITYKKAPLAELIVEVRWPVEVLAVPGGHPAPAIVSDRSASFDELFGALSVDLRKAGYHELERLVPHDMPPMAYQPVIRFKRQDSKFPLIQLGHGIFTINAGPPDYISWEVFRPTVVEALTFLASHKATENLDRHLNNVSLRYIDVFDEHLRGGKSNFSFMKDVLGVSVKLPSGLFDYTSDPESVSPTIALKMPLKNVDNANLTFQLAAGRIGQSADTHTIMDMTYAASCEPTADADELLEILKSAHDVVHAWFKKITTNLHERMVPVDAS